MSQVTSGTVSVTNGSQAVVGTGTTWLSTVTAGDGFTINDSGVTYDVASVTDDTHLTLSANYAGTTLSGLFYTIYTEFTSPDNIPEVTKGDVETATIFTRAMRTIQDLFSTRTASFTTGDARKQYQVNDAETGITLVHQSIANTLTVDFSTDADITLSTAQNTYSVYVLTDTGVVLTTGRGVITSTDERFLTVTNSTAQILTIKTLAGTGVPIPIGYTVTLYCDGTDIVNKENALLADIALSSPTTGDVYQYDGSSLIPQKYISCENFIIGGDLATNGTNPYQRGTSGTASNASYMADRWVSQDNITFTTEPTWAQTTDGLTITSNEATIHTGWALTSQKIEGYNVSKLFALDDYFVIQGKIKSSLSGTVYIALRDAGATATYVFPVVLSAGIMTSFSETVPVPVIGTWATGVNSSLVVSIVRSNNDATLQTSTLNSWQSGAYISAADQLDFHATNAATISIDKLKIEPGQIATQFWTPDYEQELRRCHRYAQKSIIAWTSTKTGVSVQYVQFPHFDEMRATPTLTSTSFNDIDASGLTINTYTADKHSIRAITMSAAETAGNRYSVTVLRDAEL